MVKLLTTGFFLLSLVSAVALPVNPTLRDSLTSVSHSNEIEEASSYRTFDQLNIIDLLESTDPIIIPLIESDDSTEYHRKKASELHQTVISNNSFVDNLSQIGGLELPVGIAKDSGNVNYAIIISKVEVKGDASYLEAYLMLELPQTGDEIAFHGSNIRFSCDAGFTGDAKLNLVGIYPILINNKTLLTLKGETKKGETATYVEFDCNGFKGMRIDAEVEFSRDLIIPEDINGNRIEDKRVSVAFSVEAQSWSDIMVGITLPPFQLKNLKDFGFYVQSAYIDWSDLANPPGLNFPKGYISPFIQSGQPSLWRGVYFQRLDVRLPKKFKEKQLKERIAIGVEHALLDEQGFSGGVFVENLISRGDMDGWSYSVDKFSLELVTNQVRGFEFQGKLTVPVIKSSDGKPSSFGYLAHRGADGNYIFAVSVGSELKLPAFAADLKIFPGSTIIVQEENDKFYPSAKLNGELSIKALASGPKAVIPGIRFENMIISSRAPHFTPGVFGLGLEGQSPSVSGYPVVISGVTVRSEADRSGVSFNLAVNIGGSPQEGGFSGQGSLTVWAKQQITAVTNAEGAQIGSETDWRFDKVEISGLSVAVKKPKICDLSGTVTFFENDPTYGDGFRGELNGTITTVGLKAVVLFGKTPTFRYWFADAMAKFETGVPMIPGVLNARGFGGGLYSRMKQVTSSPGSNYGKTESGIFYIPDENTNGIKAIMLIATPRPEAMNGEVALEVSINKYGGINSTTLTGNANFMSLANMAQDEMKTLASSMVAGDLPGKLSKLLNGQVYGTMKLHFDNVNDVFHGNLEIFVNVAGGMLKGVGDGSKAGWAELHFEKNNWHILMGTPSQPIGLEVAKIFRANSYFMLGKNLPGSPPPPSQVTEILGNVNMDYMRDMNALQSGMGYAFGLHFIMDTGNLKFLMFYGRFAAGTGIDFMLKDYGTNAHCQGSSGPIGINGWYANGQAYAFVIGKIGIKVNLKFYKGDYDIISLRAAALMQAKGPNPFWMKGIVGGDYKILGGLVKGNCRFEVTIGEECVPVGEQNLLSDANMIAQISPANNSTDVDVFNAPQVAFNIPVGEVFEITDVDSKTHYYRATLNEFVVLNDNQPIAGSLEWNNTHDVVVFNSNDILPGEKQLTARARLAFEERVNGSWAKVKFDGKFVEETRETTFETGKAPDYIPASNVAFSYPVRGQVNFHPQEYNQGFIQLKQGQSYLFEPNSDWIQKVRMTEASRQRYIETSFTYKPGEKRVEFTLPAGITTSTIYDFEILNIPLQRTLIDANVQKIENEIAPTNQEAGTATLTTKEIEGSLDRLDVKSIYMSAFRTSKYWTFADKLKTITMEPVFRTPLDVAVFRLTARLKGDESWDAAEVQGGIGVRLIEMEAILTGNVWYEQYVHPLVYEGYPIMERMRVQRENPEQLGVPPIRDIWFADVSPNSLTEGPSFLPRSFTWEKVAYNLGESVTMDFKDLRQKACDIAVYYPHLLTPRIADLILKPIPYVRGGYYKVKLQYIIPGINKVTSVHQWDLYNSAPDNN